jgi:hypothetical protein
LKIKCEGKEIELSDHDMALIWTAHTLKMWKNQIEDAIDRNKDNIIFPDENRRQTFISECVDATALAYIIDDEHDKFDEIVFDIANSDGLWSESEAE